jgi:D-alanyl-D-alanine carboxypeptidase/D-alanyl-D-alanine-endopeptidase (penicillin-binding protein 4)
MKLVTPLPYTIIKRFRILIILFALFLCASCSISKQLAKKANTVLLQDTAIMHGNIGISIYEPGTNKYWYNYNAEKYFIPASNTKLFSLYAGMKYLGDSLVGLRYSFSADTTYIKPTGDPTFLLSEFKRQPVLDFLKKQNEIIIDKPIEVESYGNGWAWDDYMDDYMVPRSVFPIYGNLLNIKWINADSIQSTPSYFQKYIAPNAHFTKGFKLIKTFDADNFTFLSGEEKNNTTPFIASIVTVSKLLNDTLKKNTKINSTINSIPNAYIIHSQPTDSLFKPMMHRSDNFFAEQTLLMASNEHLGYMSDEAMIDTLLKSDLKDLPQHPKWVDGSGLSRYNLFTPQDFVFILGKIKNEFGWGRIKNILATGGEGTLKYYFKKDAGFIFAKTGTLSNNCALSGYIITKKNKLLIFSVLTNNYITPATPVRRAVEKYIEYIRDNY